MNKPSSVCRIYHFPSPEDRSFEEVPTVKNQQPEKSWPEITMDVIGEWLIPLAAAGFVSMIFVQVVMWICMS